MLSQMFRLLSEQAGNDSWQAAVATKQMTIRQKPIRASHSPILLVKLLVDLDFDPGATASSGLKVTYTSSKTNVAVVDGQKIKVKGGGSVTITATQAGDDRNYNSATSASKSFNVTPRQSVC